jgi:hypothetical protein
VIAASHAEAPSDFKDSKRQTPVRENEQNKASQLQTFSCGEKVFLQVNRFGVQGVFLERRQ